MKPDEKIDALLQTRPIHVDSQFTEDTLRKIREVNSSEDSDEDFTNPIFQREGISRAFWIAGMAAGFLILLSIAFLSSSPFSSPSESPGLDVPKIALDPSAQPKAPATSIAPPLEELSEAEFYALESTLSEVDILLEADNLEFLYLLSADLTS